MNFSISFVSTRLTIWCVFLLVLRYFQWKQHSQDNRSSIHSNFKAEHDLRDRKSEIKKQMMSKSAQHAEHVWILNRYFIECLLNRRRSMSIRMVNSQKEISLDEDITWTFILLVQSIKVSKVNLVFHNRHFREKLLKSLSVSSLE